MINEELDRQMVTERKIYKGQTLWVGALFGGTLAAGYIIAENFKAFNRPDYAKRTWLFTALATIIFFAGTFLISEYTKIPNILLPFIYTGIAAFVIHHYQGKQIRAHIKSGGQVHKWGRVVMIGLIGLAVTFISVAGAIFIKVVVSPTDDTSISTNTYGVFNHEISYDNENITTNGVDTLALAFTVTGFFSMNKTKYVFVEKVDNNYEISISCQQSITNDTLSLEQFTQLRESVQSYYPKNKIIFNLIFDTWDNVLKRLE